MDSSVEACVMGDADMVAPLVRAGIRCAVIAPPHEPIRHSRRARYLGWADPMEQPEPALQMLLDHARQQTTRPVLYFQSDGAALLVSQHRELLSDHYRLLIADETTVKDLIDKVRFRALADRLGLPVPASGLLDSSTGPVLPAPLEFPVVMKPATRGGDIRWVDLEPDRKALYVEDQAALERLWPRVEAYGAPLLAQQLISGPETSIESYHCYVDATGHRVAEFTGRKIRTRPAAYGHTTALTITATDDVRELGREVVSTIGLVGVAKCDFKRDPDGRLWLLEVNPRYNLWHHPGAVAGVNLPALVHADLTGEPRPPVHDATPGVCWMRASDLAAARANGVSLRRWAGFAWRCETRRNVAWNDPAPFLEAGLRRVRRVVSRG